jgi:hypothetical protein
MHSHRKKCISLSENIMIVELGKARNYNYWSDRSVAETLKKE